MKKLIILFLFIINVGIVFSQTEINSIDIHINKDTISYFLSEIDSISHYENQMVNIYSNNVCHKYSVNDIESICFGYNIKHRYYQIPKENLEGWTEGCMDSNGCFIVCRQEVSDGGYFCFIGEKGKEEFGIALKFDKDMNIQTIFSKQGFLNVFTDEENNKEYGVFNLSDSIYIKSLDEITNAKSRNIMTRASAGSALNTICNWINNALTINDIGSLFSNGSGYLPGFLLGQGLTAGFWGYGHPVNLGLNLLLGWLEKNYEDNYNNILRDYMGTPMIWISDIDEKNAPNYKIQVSVEGINTFGTPMTCSLHSGVAVKIDDSHVFYENSDMHLKDHTIKSNEIYYTNLTAEKEKTYYLRPYVVVMIDGRTQFPYTRQRYLWGGPKDPLISYGDVQELKYEINISPTTGKHSNVTDKSAVVECTYQGIPEGAICGVEYEANSGWIRQTTSSGNGTRSISLSGLEPNTTYTYRAYVLYDGDIYYAKNSESFTTNPPDISGTWTCVETYYENGNYSNPQYRTYTIVLNKNGKAEVNNGEDFSSWEAFDGWSWGLYGNTLQMQCTIIATQTQNSGQKIKGTVDNLNDPKKITGRRFNWNFNQYGSFESDGWEIVMTR